MEVGQDYILNTFDLGSCINAILLIWKFLNEYRKHVVSPVALPTAINFLGMVTGRKCRGSDYAEAFIETKLVMSGCLASVLSKKANSKSLFSLFSSVQTATKAVKRLLIERFVEEENVKTSKHKHLLDFVQICSHEIMNITLQNSSILTIVEDYVAYK